MGTAMVFKRVEKKYLVNSGQIEAFKKAIEPYVNKDAYGQYTTCNIYFDTDNFQLIRTSIDKPVYKEKLRLRSYGVPKADDKVFLEIKKKYKGVVYKRRITMLKDEAMRYINNGIKPHDDSQIFNEIDYFINHYKPVPKLYLAYDRLAFSGKADSGLRITIDHNIRSRTTDLDLGAGDYGKPLLGSDQYLIELKTGTAFPLWLTKILTENKIFPTSFSKYGSIYADDLANKTTDNQKECLQCSQAS